MKLTTTAEYNYYLKEFKCLKKHFKDKNKVEEGECHCECEHSLGEQATND